MDKKSLLNKTIVEQAIFHWLNSVVIGLNLCPFSGKPMRENRVRIFISEGETEEDVLKDLSEEIRHLDATPAAVLETTLVVIPYSLQHFFDYMQCLQWAQDRLKREGWVGVYQLASFHPDYCFAGADPDDVENLTNRSPYPVIHIIRESSLAEAIKYYDDVEGIPVRNKEKVAELTDLERALLFPYLK